MKRFAIFLGGLLVLPAFGEVAPVYYDDTVEYSDMFGDESEYEFYDDDVATESKDSAAPAAKQPTVKISRQPTTSRNIANRTTASRGTPTGASSANTSARGNSTGNSSRAVAARTTNTSRSVATRGNSGRAVTSRTASSTSTTGATRSITDAVASSRAAATRATGGASQASATRTGTAATTKTTTARTATTGATATATNRAATSRAARTQATNKIYTLGNTDENPLYKGHDSSRVSIRSSTTMNNRVPTIRMASMSGVSTSESTSVTATDTTQMDELAELTDYCKAQYMACMDNYCNVLDDNQGRCSCSANLKNYAKTEEALKKATEELQEVAQKIQYIGLTAREVESLFTQTEAELQMEKTSDNSQLKTSLDKIKDMIIDAKSNPSSYSSTSSSGLSFDLSGLLDFTIDSTGFDINSFLGGFLSNGSDVKNQRGAELYKTATSRCKANVLKSCTAQGVDASLITNAYDLEIDRECLAYERDLNDSNDRMTATVRNAKSVLQKARLLVAQAKNEYDMLGCINALDSCMQDEYVCGSDYENCLDPSGRYIVNGEIVIGTDPGRAVNGIQDGTTGVLNGDICSMNLYNVWNYDTPGQTNADQSGCKNAWNSYSLEQNNGNLKDYIEQTIFENATKAKAGSSSIGMSEFLQNKIGWVDSSAKDGTRNYGMCISILNKCQDYTYTGTGNKTTYNFKNEVIKQYLYRAMVQIKAKQDQILSDYAESCVTDVNTCLSQNNYPTSREDGDWSDVQANIAVNACRSTIVTCMSVNGYSIDNPTPEDLYCWILGLKFNDNSCSRDPVTPVGSSTISWDTNGGTKTGTCPTSYTEGTSLTISNCSATRANSQFKGWCTDANLTGTCSNTPSISASDTGNKTFYAKWECDEGYYAVAHACRKNTTNDPVWYTVNVDDDCQNQCSTTTSPQTLYYLVSAGNSGKAVGWYKSKTGARITSVDDIPTWTGQTYQGHSYLHSVKVINIDKSFTDWVPPADNLTISADWEGDEVLYDLSYQCARSCYGTQPATTHHLMNATVTLNTSCATTSVPITGWSCKKSSDNTHVYPTNGQITILGHTDCVATCVGMDWAEITLNDSGATTSSNPAKVYFDMSGHCDNRFHQEASCTSDVVTNIQKPTKTNNNYAGHFTGENGTGVMFINADGVIQNPGDTITDNITIYAQWEPGTPSGGPGFYTITLHDNCSVTGGSCATQSSPQLLYYVHTAGSIGDNTYTVGQWWRQDNATTLPVDPQTLISDNKIIAAPSAQSGSTCAFGGFWTAADGGNLVISTDKTITGTPTSSATWHAHWNNCSGEDDMNKQPGVTVGGLNKDDMIVNGGQ